MTRVVTLGALAVFATTGSSASAQPTDTKSEQIQFLGFSQDGELFALKVNDLQRTPRVEILESKSMKPVGRYPFSDDTDFKKAWSKAKQKHKVDKPSADKGPEHPTDGITILTSQKKDKFFILATKCGKLAPYDAIDVLKGSTKTEKDIPAKANQVELVWDQGGKYVVIVYHQKIPGSWAWESDFVHAFKFKPSEVPFECEGE
jgi:hypothetical protein